MAGVTALRLRGRAREAMLGAGGRGFVRFLPEGGALLATDAIRRCADDAACAHLTQAIAAAGFVCAARGGLLEMTPADGELSALCAFAPHAFAPHAGLSVDWEAPLHPAQALACRFCRHAQQPLTPAGRQLILETLRLTWRDAAHLLSGLPALRARAAVMLRRGDRSGLYEAGTLLAEFLDDTGGRNDG